MKDIFEIEIDAEKGEILSQDPEGDKDFDFIPIDLYNDLY
jgi:hypothetical protein